ncbi:MAG TPA: response regulator transcription factor [Nannocystis exedens]|nr:response regulator transcription factor [Nannocystis exedens]
MGVSTERALRVLIADDEELARRRLLRLLGELAGVEIAGECSNGAEVLAFLRGDVAVDVVLLDIRMPGLDGIETGALLPEQGPEIIYTTAYGEHALAAFDVGAVDYLLKPIEALRLRRALDRVQVRPYEPSVDGLAFQRLAVSTRDGVVLIDPRKLSHAIFDGTLVSLHSEAGVVLSDYSLQELQERLPAATFERVHRRALVNLERIERLEPLATGGYRAHMIGGGTVPIARQAARRLRRRLGIS